MDPDLELLDRWRAGEKQAGEALFTRHFAGLFRFFDGKVGARADDLTQQTFLECTRSRHQFRGDSSFRTYLFGIAWNELRQFIRRELVGARVDFDSSSMNDIAALMTSPSGQVDRAQRSERVRKALAELPLAQQVLLEYHYWHELDAAALAEVFDTTAGAIRVRLLRARVALRARLGETIQGDASADEERLLARARGEAFHP